MRHTARGTTLLATLWLAGASAAAAQTTIAVPSNGASVGCTSGPAEFFCGQSFTAPATDPVLQRFTFTLQTDDALTFELFALSGTTLVGPALLTLPFGPTAGTTPAPLTFIAPAGGLALTGGATYAALIHMNPAEGVAFAARSGNAYAAGSAMECAPPRTCLPSADMDLAFSAVFGAAAPVVTPEPGAWALLGTGLLGVAGTRVRRRRTTR